MNNSSETGFVRGLACHLSLHSSISLPSTPVHVCILDYRLTGNSNVATWDGKPTATTPATAEGWRDFDSVLDHVEKFYPGSVVHLVGQSLGGGMCLKYAGSTGGPGCRVASAMGVCPPVDYGAVASHLEDGPVSRACNFIMTIPCKVSVLMNGRCRRRLRSAWRAAGGLTVRDFEREVVCELCGYDTPEDYYDANR